MTKYKDIFKITFSVILAVLFFYIAYTYLLEDTHKKLLFEISLKNHFIAGLFLIAFFLVSGIELKYVYKKTAGLKFTAYDTFSIPYVINIWGYIIPLQGSFLYMMSYLKLKYAYQIKKNVYVYAFIFLVNLSFFGLIGLLLISFTDFYTPVIFLILLFTFLLPLFLFVANYIFSKINSRLTFLNRIFTTLDYIISNLKKLMQNHLLVIYVILFNIAMTLLSTLWAYWICYEFGFNVPFSVLFLISIIMKLSMLFKITPGNLGITQLANGGIFFLFGYDPSIGIFISIFKFITLFLFSFPLGIIFSALNLKHFSLNKIKALFSKSEFHLE